MAVWKKRIKQRKLAHLEDSKKNGKQVVNNLQNVNSEKSATAEIDNQLRKWVADKHFAEVPFDNLPGYNTIKRKEYLLWNLQSMESQKLQN